eukprot:4015045-Amphidinium_carterae.1
MLISWLCYWLTVRRYQREVFRAMITAVSELLESNVFVVHTGSAANNETVARASVWENLRKGPGKGSERTAQDRRSGQTLFA